MSYSSDLVANLSNSLQTWSPRLLATPTPPLLREQSQSDYGHPTASASTTSISKQSEEEDRLNAIRSTIVKLSPNRKRPLTADKLATLAEGQFPPFQGLGSVPVSQEAEGAESLLVAQLSISAYGIVVGQLIEQARLLGEEDEYWAQLESDPWRASMYLLQTGPSRAVSVASVAVTRLRAITTSSLHSSTPSRSLLSINTFRHALPPNVILGAAFPHLAPNTSSFNTASTNTVDADTASLLSLDTISGGPAPSVDKLYRRTRKLLFMTLSPLVLGRQEIAQRRKDIKSARDDLAEKLGTLTLASTSSLGLKDILGSQSVNMGSPEELRTATWETLRLLDRTLSREVTMTSTPPTTPGEVAQSLIFLLRKTLHNHSASFAATLDEVERPSAVIRAWPVVLSIPLVGYLIGRTVYASRETIYSYATTAKETVQGFLIDWVLEPVKKILETVRHGDDTAMALMGKESLKSDLESLERMVVDFGRDEYRLTPEELQALSEKVKVGDLTSVLKAWEKDIKSPIRSAVSGSLIRTLLIQVQKVKVDVALAMDGIEKMLRSQQLTFAFVGVAPSLIVLVGVGQWVRGLLRTDGGKKHAREVRRKNWATMRHLDALLSPSPSSSPSSKASQAQTQGFLILELTALRSYATSRYFPTKDTQLTDAFLQDVRALENSGTESQMDVRRVLVDRLWRWSDALGWNNIL
ncbi:NCA2-domain-containing protein [Meredithblackwellia eburnea MCA 4105]